MQRRRLSISAGRPGVALRLPGREPVVAGFTFTEPELTRRLLDGIRAERKGIMLDIGHLMNCDTSLRTLEEGADYVHACWTGMEVFAGTSGGFIFTAPSAGNMSGPIRFSSSGVASGLFKAVRLRLPPYPAHRYASALDFPCHL